MGPAGLATCLPSYPRTSEKRRIDMKDQIRNFVIGIGLAAVLWAPLLKAQDQLEVTVPFDFHVGQANLPAGEYNVIHMSSATIQLRNAETGKSILLMPTGLGSSKPEPQLAFHCYGDRCFLSEIRVPERPAYVLSKSSLERETEKGEIRATMAYVPMERR